MATEIKKYTDQQLDPFRRMGEIKLLAVAQTSEDYVGLMDLAKKAGLGISLATEAIKFGLEKNGRKPTGAMVCAGRALGVGLAVGGFIGQRFFDVRADRAAHVLEERMNDPRYSGTRRYVERLADRIFDQMTNEEEK